MTRVPAQLMLAILSLVGLALFGWPFVAAAATPDLPALAIGIGALAGLVLTEIGARRLDARMLALLAAIAAIDAGLRLALVTGIAGFSPIFFLVLCAGYAFGPSYGFQAGAVALLVSAVATGGIGPWLPFQLFGVGWVGLAAGLIGGFVSRLTGRGAADSPTRRDLLILATVGALMGLALGAPVLAAFWRIRVRSSFRIVDAVGVDTMAAGVQRPPVATDDQRPMRS